MRETLRTAAVSLAPTAVVAAVWLRLERPVDAVWEGVALVALAVAVAAVRPLPARLAALLVAAILAARLAFGLWPPRHPLHLYGDYLAPLGSRFGQGFVDFYAVELPFDPAAHSEMRGLVLAALFGFVLLVTLAVATRRPVVGVLALLAGAGWPATLMGPSRALLTGTAILLAGLAMLAGMTHRRLPAAALPVAAALALGAFAASSSPAVAKEGLVAWQKWDPTSHHVRPVSVSFVWNSHYLGIHFPKRKTTVLEVQAPQTASLYWRAAVLDDFVLDGWQIGPPRAADWLEPARAAVRSNDVEQTVTVKALADTRLVGGSVPIGFDAGGTPLSQPDPGFATLPSGLTNGFRYRVWSFAPQPTADDLRRSSPTYPDVLTQDGLLEVWPGVSMPAFGTPSRAELAQRLLAAHPEVAPYGPLDRLAEQVAGGAGTPYGAAVALERWFRTGGGFRYTGNVHPVYPNPLVGFVTQTRAGYCQYFAGAMALMLRYLGVPARVAVGFSSGSYDTGKQAWIVTDHDAHAWVEAWFAGYGWLPFDPTPAGLRPEQGTLSARYSAASPGFGLPPGASTAGGPAPSAQSAHRHGETGGGSRAGGRGGSSAQAGQGSHSTRNALLALLALLLAGSAGAVALAKLARRWARLLARDPRRAAAGCRRELASFLVDQRLDAARSATLHELGVLVREQLLVEPERFVAAASAARFGRPEAAERAAREARRELRALLRQLRARLSPAERLRGLFSLRSLGLAA